MKLTNSMYIQVLQAVHVIQRYSNCMHFMSSSDKTYETVYHF